MADKIDMTRKWNWPIWAGFLVAVGGLVSYTFFARFPITPDFPWANLLLFSTLLAVRNFIAVRSSARSSLRSRFFFSRFLVTKFFYVLHQVPLSSQAPRVGEKAPEFTLVDPNGKPVALADLLSGSKAVVLIFYRGFW